MGLRKDAGDAVGHVMSPAELRRRARTGAFDGPTSGHAPGFVQTNVVILPQAFAAEFAEYCARNPRPCPLIAVSAPGDPAPGEIAPGADIRTDIPRYRVFRDGAVADEPADILALWQDDLVTFHLGCSFIAEAALQEAGLILPHIAASGFVPMYRTTVATEAVGRFAGPLVVSMRPFTPKDADRAAAITAHYPMAHGAPIHRGDPAALGIRDLERPEYGRAVPIASGQIPVFWACGVTPQEALMRARLPLAITHAPGHMFVADRRAETTRI